MTFKALMKGDVRSFLFPENSFNTAIMTFVFISVDVILNALRFWTVKIGQTNRCPQAGQSLKRTCISSYTSVTGAVMVGTGIRICGRPTK
jgi:hypothetical protein